MTLPDLLRLLLAGVVVGVAWCLWLLWRIVRAARRG